jgi:hypothetical protein
MSGFSGKRGMVARKPPSGRVSPPTWRRQWNEAFITPDGTFSTAKAFTALFQAATLVLYWIYFEKIIATWDIYLSTAMIMLAPEMLKKFMAMKYGGKGKDD